MALMHTSPAIFLPQAFQGFAVPQATAGATPALYESLFGYRPEHATAANLDADVRLDQGAAPAGEPGVQTAMASSTPLSLQLHSQSGSPDTPHFDLTAMSSAEAASEVRARSTCYLALGACRSDHIRMCATTWPCINPTSLMCRVVRKQARSSPQSSPAHLDRPRSRSRLCNRTPSYQCSRRKLFSAWPTTRCP